MAPAMFVDMPALFPPKPVPPRGTMVAARAITKSVPFASWREPYTQRNIQLDHDFAWRFALPEGHRQVMCLSYSCLVLFPRVMPLRGDKDHNRQLDMVGPVYGKTIDQMPEYGGELDGIHQSMAVDFLRALFADKEDP